MELTWSLEELARTSDDAAVRRRFAQRNRTWLVFFLFLALIVSMFEMGSKARTTDIPDVLIGATHFVLSALALVALRYTWGAPAAGTLQRRAGAWAREHVSAFALTAVAVHYALALAFNRDSDDWYAWTTMLPFFVLPLRMLVSELILLHGMLLLGGLVMPLVGFTPKKGLTGMLISLVVLNAVTLAVQLYFSHRMRKTLAGEWSSRRTQAREQIRMREELRYARELQLSMLPECAPALGWADICSASIPATEVGGDYYDYFVEEDRIALVCGDVAGHGMAAGLVLSALRSGFTLLRDSLGDPAAVLQRLHDLVAQTTRRRMLVTVAVVLIDRDHRSAVIASAGHPPVIFRRADGSVETIDLYAPPLGVRLPVNIPQRRIDVAPGDTFVLHSDGIYETRNAAGDVYGLERFQRLIARAGGDGAEALRDAILRDVSEFRGGAEPDDDVTVVVCRLA